MIQELLTASRPTNPMPYSVAITRRPTMPSDEALQLCAELLTDHGVRFSASNLKYLGPDLITWLNQHAGSWMVVRTHVKKGDDRVSMLIALEKEEAMISIQLMA